MSDTTAYIYEAQYQKERAERAESEVAEMAGTIAALREEREHLLSAIETFERSRDAAEAELVTARAHVKALSAPRPPFAKIQAARAWLAGEKK